MTGSMFRVAGLAACVLTTAAPAVAQDAIFPKGVLSHPQNQTATQIRMLAPKPICLD